MAELDLTYNGRWVKVWQEPNGSYAGYSDNDHTAFHVQVFVLSADQAPVGPPVTTAEPAPEPTPEPPSPAEAPLPPVVEPEAPPSEAPPPEAAPETATDESAEVAAGPPPF